MIFGLTGGIACGKSTVSKMLKEASFDVLDLDAVAHEVLCYDSVKNEVRNLLGDNVFGEDGELLRKVIGSIVFADKCLLSKFEAIVHTEIKGIVRKRVETALDNGDLLILDHPLLVDKNELYLVDKVIVVDIPLELQLDRLQVRNSLSYDSAVKRINTQITREKRLKHADYILDNSGDLAFLESQVVDLIAMLHDFKC